MFDNSNFDPQQLFDLLPILSQQGKELCEENEKPAVFISEDSDGSFKARVCGTKENEKGEIYVSRILEWGGKALIFGMNDLQKLIDAPEPNAEA